MWNNQPGDLYLDVDISKCGFADTPVITVSVEGNGALYHTFLAGTSTIVSATSTKFQMHFRGYIQTSHFTFTERPNTSEAIKRHWNIMWSAFGFKSGC